MWVSQRSSSAPSSFSWRVRFWVLLLAVSLCQCQTPAFAQTSPTNDQSEMPSDCRSMPSGQLRQILASRLLQRTQQAMQLEQLSLAQQQQILSLQTSSQALEQKLASSESYSTQLRQELASSQAQLETLRESSRQTQTSLASLQAEIIDLKAKLKDYDASVAKVNADIKRQSLLLELERNVAVAAGGVSVAILCADAVYYLVSHQSMMSLVFGH